MQSKLRYLVQYAVLAPSTHNSQPWLFRVAGSSVFIFADRSRGIAVLDPEDRSLVMSCGAALYNFTAALKAFGYGYRVSRFPELSDPDLLARVDVLDRTEGSLDLVTLDLMKRRRTVRDTFRKGKPEPGALQSIATRVASQGAHLVLLSPEQVESIRDLERTLPGMDLSLKRELSFWHHPNRSRSRDGVPGEAIQIETFLGHEDSSVTFAALATPGDRMASWLHGGMGLQAGLLEATALGLGVMLSSSPVHIPSVRSDVSALVAPGETVQVLLKLGLARHGKATPRRALVDVMMHPGFSK